MQYKYQIDKLNKTNKTTKPLQGMLLCTLSFALSLQAPALPNPTKRSSEHSSVWYNE